MVFPEQEQQPTPQQIEEVYRSGLDMIISVYTWAGRHLRESKIAEWQQAMATKYGYEPPKE